MINMADINFNGNPLIQNDVFHHKMLADKPQTAKLNLIPEGQFEVKDADVVPLVSRRKRVSTRQDVECVQLTYREMAMTCFKTTYSSRTNLLKAPHVTRNTVPVYKIQGIAVDPRFDDYGRLIRVWLMNPAVVDPEDPSHTIPIDTHLWLMMTRMTMDPLNEDNTVSRTAGLGGDQVTVTLGDTLTIECTLMTYEASSGRGGKRIGVDAWRPIDSKMLYVTQGDHEQVVPRHLKGDLKMFGVDQAGRLDSVYEWTWYDDLKAALKNRPDNGGVFYRMKEVAPRMEAQAAIQILSELEEAEGKNRVTGLEAIDFLVKDRNEKGGTSMYTVC